LQALQNSETSASKQLVICKLRFRTANSLVVVRYRSIFKLGKMLKAKMTISEISIPLDKVSRSGGAGAGTIGHAFSLRARLKVSKRTMGSLAGEGIDYPELEWKEIIDWFEHHPDGTWQNKGEVKKDMFAANPNSNTFKTWQEYRYFLASDPTNNPPAGLKEAVDKAANNDKDKAAKHWIATNGFEWTIAVTDRPAIGLAGGSGGGGGESLVTGNSRRRVIYFDLGFKGSPTRVSATQILESINGTPTIQKFFVPGISKAVADNPTNLAHWRTQLAQPETFRP
jgi:hypothetical protein